MSSGRLIAVGDVHGCDLALETLLAVVAPQPQDCVVQLGDVIDRGPNSRRCIDLLLELRNRCRLIHLMGNHEEMLLDALAGGEWSRGGWLSYGGEEMLHSYGGSFDLIPAAHLDFIRNGKDYFETETTIFVHGNLRPEVPVEQETSEWLRWARFQPISRPHCSGKRVICGHTAQRHGRPVGGPYYLCLDTCAYCREGWLSALDVGTNTLWQTNQRGETRGPAPLDDLLNPA